MSTTPSAPSTPNALNAPNAPISSFSQPRNIKSMINTYPFNPKNWSKTTIIVLIIAVLVIIIIVLAIVLGVKDSHPFASMLRQSEHAGTPNKPVIIDSELNWNQKYNFGNDDRTADEYYDDRIYNHAGHISAPKHKTDFKLPGTVTVYRKYTEKSAN
jgi:hypothetical protein